MPAHQSCGEYDKKGQAPIEHHCIYTHRLVLFQESEYEGPISATPNLLEISSFRYPLES